METWQARWDRHADRARGPATTRAGKPLGIALQQAAGSSGGVQHPNWVAVLMGWPLWSSPDAP